MTERERWREIPGFDDYFASSWGRIRSFKARGGGRVLRPATAKYGYKFVGLMSNAGRMKVMRIHALVCLAFIGPRPDSLEVCHRDGNAANNRIENLRYDTRAANGADTILNNLHNKGRSSTIDAIESKQRRLIRHYLLSRGIELYFSGAGTLRQIAKRIGYCELALSKAVRRQRGYIDLRSMRYVLR